MRADIISSLSSKTVCTLASIGCVHLECHVVVLNCLQVVTPLVLSGSSGISCIDVTGIYFQDSGKVIYAHLFLVQFLVNTSTDVVRACIEFV